MRKFSLSKAILGSEWIKEGLISHPDGLLSKAFTSDPFSSGLLEEGLEGSNSDNYFSKLSDLLSKLPNNFEGQVLLVRKRLDNCEIPGFQTTLYFFETVKKAESYSHIQVLLSELGIKAYDLSLNKWKDLLSMYFTDQIYKDQLPDVTWGQDSIEIKEKVAQVLSLTELPQLTWKGCLQPIFESPFEFTLSLKYSIPDRAKIKRQLETKRRVNHALSVTSSAEVRNIESNSLLSSSEETLERILVGKETLFEISLALILLGKKEKTTDLSHEFERVISGIGNAGLFLEGVGSLPVFKSHIPGNKILGIRKLPILSENLAHLFPLIHDYSRQNDKSSLELRSRSEELSYLNLFSKENLNYNSFICGASGSGKSFLMNAFLASTLKDDPKSRLCIFDVGGSYQRIIQSNGGKTASLNNKEAMALIASFLIMYPVTSKGFFRSFVETLCGSGAHLTHSHKVAIDDLLRDLDGKTLRIQEMIRLANKRSEKFYHDIAHWLKPHIGIDLAKKNSNLVDLIRSPISAFDFKELDSDPILQKATILILTELLWGDLMNGKYSRTLIVFDEVWRFFAQSKGFLEEMYRTLRKYKAGIVSITQNLADYGDEAFAKMLFTNSFTKIFLQNGATAEYLKNTFDLPSSDIKRALSVTSKKPVYSEFFTLTPIMSQVFRLYPTKEFYELANTESIASNNKKISKTNMEA